MKIIRAYIITALICMCITASAAFVFIADENAKKISLGQESAVLVIGSADKRLSPQETDISLAAKKAVEILKKAAGIAPPPVSNIYWLVVTAGKTET